MEEADAGRTPPEDVLGVLADADRRTLLSYVLAADGPVPVDDLVATLARERGTAEQEAAIAVHHVHVPVLVDVGLLRHDADAGAVDIPPSTRTEWVADLLASD